MDAIPATSGIYRIVCIPTGKFYIGSALNLYRRYYGHLGTLRQNRHKNIRLQNAWNKYGEAAFAFEVIELVLPPFLLEREQYWLDKLQAVKRGLNIAPLASSHLGMKRPIETGKRISAAKRGKPSPHRGYKMTPEELERHRLARIGKKPTEETRRRMGIAHRGTKRSPETKEKMRNAAIGHAPTNARTFIVTSPVGTEYVVYGLKGFCREHHLNSGCLNQVAKGNRAHHKGWKARYPA